MIDDVIGYNLKILYCGTALGNVSFRDKAYYANPTNKFWKVLYNTGLTPYQIPPQSYRDLIKYDQGLTDVVKTNYGLDNELSKDDYDCELLIEKIIKFQPQWLVFNGKNAAKRCLNLKKIDYGMQQKQIHKTQIYVAPSTSGAANGYWDEDVWSNLAVIIKFA